MDERGRAHHSVAKTSFAAAIVLSMSSSEWARDMKPACEKPGEDEPRSLLYERVFCEDSSLVARTSYDEGARYTPRSSIPRCHLANFSVSALAAASAKHLVRSELGVREKEGCALRERRRRNALLREGERSCRGRT